MDYEVDDRTLDKAFDLLREERRRYALVGLRETADGVATVDDLADYLAGRTPDGTDRERAKIALYHKILPKLADAGVVDFDPRTSTVRYRGTELVEDLLDFATTRRE